MFYTTILPSAAVILCAAVCYRSIIDIVLPPPALLYSYHWSQAGPDLEFNYAVYPNVFNRSSSYSRHAHISLIVHGSVNNFKYLLVTLLRWTGPIELVAYSSASNQELFDTLNAFFALRHCLQGFHSRVNVHMVLDSAVNLSDMLKVLTNSPWNRRGSGWSCDNLEQFVSSGSPTLKKRANFDSEAAPYPANLLRNVGKSQTKTNFNLVLDMDVILSANLFESANDLLGRLSVESLVNVALILPAFETDILCTPQNMILSNKNDLLNAIVQSHARPFYSAVNRRVQEATNFPKWYRIKSPKLSLAYWADWRDPYEPFVIVHKSAPQYDQRFVRYGVNRLSNLCHLHVAGWNFAVLCDAFVVHCGFKSVQGFHAKRNEELKENQELYKGDFMIDLLNLYPESTRSC